MLVSGGAGGELDALFQRVATVNANHGPFACLLCAGDFWGSSVPPADQLAPYASGELHVPMRTYVLGQKPDGSGAPDSEGLIKLAPDMYCLSRAAIAELLDPRQLQPPDTHTFKFRRVNILRNLTPHHGGGFPFRCAVLWGARAPPGMAPLLILLG